MLNSSTMGKSSKYYLLTNWADIFHATGYLSSSQTERELIAIAKISPTETNHTKLKEIRVFTPGMFYDQAIHQIIHTSHNRNYVVNVTKLDSRQKFSKAITDFLDEEFNPDQNLGLRLEPELEFDPTDLTVAERDQFGERFSQEFTHESSKSKISFAPCEPKNWPWRELRQQKTTVEVDKLKAAAELAHKAYQTVIPMLKPGITEAEFKFALETEIRKRGAEPSFPSIVAFGENSAIPHYQSGSRELKKGDPVLIDWGARLAGYCSDATRSFAYGQASSQYRQRWERVKAAYDAGLEAIRVKQSQRDLHEAVFAELGELREWLNHSLGHGIGIEVHESPNYDSKSEHSFPKSTVITLEPAVYFPGWGGIRLENTIASAEVLNPSDFDLEFS